MFQWRVRDGKIAYMLTDDTGNADFQARACLRGRVMRQWVNNPDRLQYPMKRTGQRGLGEFERISWDEAIQTIVDKLKYTIDTYGNDAIFVNYATVLYDPKLDTDVVGPAYAALLELEPQEAADQWPFGESTVAEEAFELMVEDLSLTMLTVEYRRLFVGPGPKAAPPWGSVYTDRDQVFFGESTLDLRDWLREHRIIVAKGERDEPEDSIGLMLELMAWIADEQPEVLDEYLTLHFLPWAPHMLEAMEEAATHPFFKGLAQLTRASLEGIQKARNLAVELPRFYR